MERITDILNKFGNISLKEMDSVQLLDRVDTKFTFHIDKLPEFLEKMLPHYRILEVNNVRCNNYESLYFDTEKLNFFLQHHNGKLNRYKVRCRCYTASGDSFFEIKFKNNKARTKKQRIQIPCIQQEIKDDAEKFLTKKTGINSDELQPKLWVYYSRMTFVNNVSKERLTIDLNINYRSDEKTFAYPSLVIAEVKQEKSAKSPFLYLMKESHVRKDAISKYCLGIVSVFDHVKKNNFKYKINSLNKICYDKN